MRLFKFLPAGVLALVLAACGGNASEGTATADAATPAGGRRKTYGNRLQRHLVRSLP